MAGLPRSSSYSGSAPVNPRSASSSAKGAWSMSTPAEEAPPNPQHGFQRMEMYSTLLVGTVKLYERHIFLGWGAPASWPSAIESGGALPKLLADAIKAKKKKLLLQTKLTVFEAKDGGDFRPGDALVFPDMICVRGLTRHDVDTFVDEVLVESQLAHLESSALPLSGSHVFVCCHGTRDARCGACGPELIRQLKEEVEALGMDTDVWLHPCSHVGGHHFAGNVIIFSRLGGTVHGDWYGYVTPSDCRALLESHIGRGEILEHLWRGRMGLTEEQQKEMQASGRNSALPCGGSRGACEQCPCRQGMSGSLTDGSSPDAELSPCLEPIESCCNKGAASCAPPRKARVVLKAPKSASPAKPTAVQSTEAEAMPAGTGWTTKVVDRLRTWSLPDWLERFSEDRMVVTTAVVAISASVAVSVAWRAARAN